MFVLFPFFPSNHQIYQLAKPPSSEAIIPGSGSILHDGAQVSGKVRIFNQDGLREMWVMVDASTSWFGRLQKEICWVKFEDLPRLWGPPSVRQFREDRGFGFVTVDADETDLYFHIKDMLQEDQQKVSNGLKLPGQRVSRLHQAEYTNLCFMRGHSIKPTTRQDSRSELHPIVLQPSISGSD